MQPIPLYTFCLQLVCNLINRRLKIFLMKKHLFGGFFELTKDPQNDLNIVQCVRPLLSSVCVTVFLCAPHQPPPSGPSLHRLSSINRPHCAPQCPCCCQAIRWLVNMVKDTFYNVLYNAPPPSACKHF